MPESAFMRIVNEIKSGIESGKYPPGSKLPTYRELRETYSVSDQVVRDAMMYLRGAGLVDGQPGSGSYVAEKRTDPRGTADDRVAPRVAMTVSDSD